MKLNSWIYRGMATEFDPVRGFGERSTGEGKGFVCEVDGRPIAVWSDGAQLELTAVTQVNGGANRFTFDWHGFFRGLDRTYKALDEIGLLAPARKV
ncbi:MAG: hypothetical protein ACO1OB_19075, partial [Archangium sp.]